MKRLFRLALLVAVVGAIVWWFRDHLIPPPTPPLEHPPHFRSAPHPHEDTGDRQVDDLTVVKGIGPVYRERLGDQGITTFAQLAGSDAATVATAIDVAVTQVVDWQEQARHLS